MEPRAGLGLACYRSVSLQLRPRTYIYEQKYLLTHLFTYSYHGLLFSPYNCFLHEIITHAHDGSHLTGQSICGEENPGFMRVREHTMSVPTVCGLGENITF